MCIRDSRKALFQETQNSRAKACKSFIRSLIRRFRIGIVTVSYTHLDVYKRQAFFWIWVLVLIFGKRLSHFTSNLCRTLDNMIDGDVYKRQAAVGIHSVPNRISPRPTFIIAVVPLMIIYKVIETTASTAKKAQMVNTICATVSTTALFFLFPITEACVRCV